MRIFKRALAGLFTLAFATFGLSTLSAQAVTMGCTVTGGGGNSGASLSLTHSTMAYCEAANDTNTITPTYSLFGMTGWVLSEKNDDNNGDGTIEFTSAPINGNKSGNWTIDTLAGLSHVVITLVAGNGFGAFLLDLSVNDPLTGSWTSSKDLSHASIYYKGTPTMVPLPAGAVLLLTGLAGLGFAARRRMKR
nr:VPLPA-CTERM sorting domain-containing protein [uncultured Roseibium sp.]